MVVDTQPRISRALLSILETVEPLYVVVPVRLTGVDLDAAVETVQLLERTQAVRRSAGLSPLKWGIVRSMVPSGRQNLASAMDE